MRISHGLSALIIASSVLLGAGSASAGGPTSALLVDPGTGRSASLTLVDDYYGALMALVGADDGSAGRVDKGAAGHASGSEITVSWLAHNVWVWRVDRIYVDAPGGPWIATHSAMPESQDIFAAPPTWHTAADGSKLMTLLERIGIIGGDVNSLGRPPADVGETEPEVAAEAAPVEPAARAGQQGETATNAAASPHTRFVLAVLLGLALGIALTAAISVARGGAASRRTGHREPAAVTEDSHLDDHQRIDDDVSWSAREELSSVLEPR